MPQLAPIIREEEQDAIRCRWALMRAHARGVLTHYGTFDLSEPDQVEALHEQLGPDTDMPEDDGVYALVSVPTASGELLRLCLPEGLATLGAVVGIAAAHGPEAVADVLWRVGLMPDGLRTAAPVTGRR